MIFRYRRAGMPHCVLRYAALFDGQALMSSSSPSLVMNVVGLLSTCRRIRDPLAN